MEVDNAGGHRDGDRDGDDECNAGLALTVTRDVAAAGEPLADRRGPAWLTTFIQFDYFVGCGCQRHSLTKFFCIQCRGGLCKAEVDQVHRSHSCLQVRKASHEFSIKIEDIQPFVNLTDIQFFLINRCPIVFIKQRTKQPTTVIAMSHCVVCDRSLMQESKRFCSIECKLRAVVSGVDPALTMVGSSCAYNREAVSRHTAVNQHLHYVGHHAKVGGGGGGSSITNIKKMKTNKKLAKKVRGMAALINTINRIQESTEEKCSPSGSETATIVDRSSPESEVLNVAAVINDDATSFKSIAKRRKNRNPSKSPTF